MNFVSYAKDNNLIDGQFLFVEAASSSLGAYFKFLFFSNSKGNKNDKNVAIIKDDNCTLLIIDCDGYIKENLGTHKYKKFIKINDTTYYIKKSFTNNINIEFYT